MNKKVLLSVAVVSIAGLSYLGTGYAFAQNASNPETTIVQKIATKFGLNQADVQAVFDEQRNERQQQMQARFEEKLTQLVKDGKLNEDQKTKILAKFSEMRNQRQATKDEFKNMTPEEREADRDKRHAELKTWAEANGINIEVLDDAFGPGHEMGKHMMR